jgi:hypothetical protein
MIPLPQTILVLWRAPGAGDLLPVGRLVVRESTPRFEFTYEPGVATARDRGFALFLEFPDVAHDYTSDELFPLFANRLMGASRPDYPAWVERHGLEPGTLDELSLLVRADGRRATDRVELIGLPTRADGRPTLTSWFFARGLTAAQENEIGTLVKGESLEISDAHREELRTGLKTRRGQLVGYVPNSAIFQVQDVVRDAVLPTVFVERVNPPPTPIHHRLLCRLEQPFDGPAGRSAPIGSKRSVPRA